MVNPLFLPLKSIFFESFRDGSKTHELRGISKQFNLKTVYTGRRVFLSKGYTKERLSGTIGRVLIFKSTHDIVNEEDNRLFNAIIPLSLWCQPFVNNEIREFLDFYEDKYKKTGFIVFEIKIDKLK